MSIIEAKIQVGIMPDGKVGVIVEGVSDGKTPREDAANIAQAYKAANEVLIKKQEE